MRIISQNGKSDVPYKNARIAIGRNDDSEYSKFREEKQYLLLADYKDAMYLLASFDDMEEAKKMLLDIAYSWKHNYPIFYCGEEGMSRDHEGLYECFHCGAKAVVWSCDYDFEDFGYEEKGIVQVCHCTNCGAKIEYLISCEEDDE